METIEHRAPVTFDGVIRDVELTVGVHNRVVAVWPRVYRPIDGPIEAYPRTALLVPSRLTQYRHPISVLLAAIHAARECPEPSTVLVTGVVTPSEPAALGQHRVDALRCVVEYDAAAWETIATRAGSLLEVKAYLDYLATQRGWPCSVETIDAVADAAAERSVRRFQEEFNRQFQRSIYEDGVCGTETLRAVLEVLRFEWERWLEKHGLAQADVDATELVYASGGSLPAALPSLRPLNGLPGVDVVVLRKQDLGGADVTPELLYHSRTARWDTFDVPLEVGGWEFGSYTIVTDLAPGESESLETYRLSSTDGSWASELEVARDGVEDGLLELRFTDVPCDKRYALTVEIESVGRYILFEDLAYGDLHKVAVGELDPPPLDPEAASPQPAGGSNG